ncbi:hypothetical protein JNW90_10735 [Micromonospora sp. STR1s_5]|nr:hypothetical protein [Micromonospora sp. STR1s_5]
MTNRPVRLVLDRSALLAYVAGSVHVAEPLHEVEQDGVRFGVPVPVAAEALNLAHGKDLALMHRLLALDVCVLLPLTPEHLPELTFWRRITGRLDLAAAALAALTLDAAVLTSEGTRYGGGVPAIYFPE